MSVTRRSMSLLRSLALVASLTAAAFAWSQSQPLNASFETPALVSVGRQANPSGAGWTFTGTAGVERLAATQSSTVTAHGGLVGQQAAYLSHTGTHATAGAMSQTVTVPTAGNYQLRFVARSIGTASLAVRIAIDSGIVEDRLVPRANPGRFETWWTAVFNLTAGTHTIKFEAIVPNGYPNEGDTIQIDQVTLVSDAIPLTNASFEWGSNFWALWNGASVGGGGPGSSGPNVLHLPEGHSYDAMAKLTAAVTLPAGNYSVSARMAARSVGETCETFIQFIGPTVASVTLGVSREVYYLTPVTSNAATLSAGTYTIQVNRGCNWTSNAVTMLDAITINPAGSAFANATFASPDLGPLADDYSMLRQTNPTGSGWTFTGANAGIQANAGRYAGAEVRTDDGRQFADMDTAPGSLSQSVIVQPGTYILVAMAARGTFQFTMNGLPIGGSLHGSFALGDLYDWDSEDTVQSYPLREVMSEPFTITAAGPVTFGFNALTFFSLQSPRLIRIAKNLPPVVRITSPTAAPGKNYAIAQGPGQVSVAVSATAEDSDGLQVNTLYFTSNDVAVGPNWSASPFSSTITGLAVGTYRLRAYATDTLGAQGKSDELLLKVNNPPQGGFTVSPSGALTTTGTAPVNVTVTPIATDSDGSVVQTDVLLDGVLQSLCVRTSSPWACTLSLAPRATAYAISARAKDSDDGLTTYPSTAVVINSMPTVAVTTPAVPVSVLYGTPYTVIAKANDLDNGIAIIQLRDNGTNLGTPCLFTPAPGTERACSASLPATADPGSHSITVVATDGATVPLTATSSAIVLTVVTTSTTTLVASVPSISPGQAFKLHAKVDPCYAEGNVTFKDGETVLCSAVPTSWNTDPSFQVVSVVDRVKAPPGSNLICPASTDAVMHAYCNVSQGVTTPGTHMFTADYVSTTFLTNSRGTLNLKGTSATTLAQSSGNTVYGDSKTLTATVTPNAATGSVVFTDTNASGVITTLCGGNIALSAAAPKTASCTFSSGDAGVHTYRATYSGDTDYAQSSITVSHTIQKASPTLTPSSSRAAPIAGQSIDLIATMNLASATGNVRFTETIGATTVDICAARPLSGGAPNRATCTFQPAAGTHNYTLAYAGDANHNAATANFSLTVVPNLLPSVSILTPGADAIVVTPASFAFTANASDQDGTVSSVEYFNVTAGLNDNTRIGVSTSPPWAVPWNNVTSGTYYVRAKATDDLGGVAYSNAIRVFANNAPLVSLPVPASTSYISPANIVLTANATDTDGSISQVKFYRSQYTPDESTYIGTGAPGAGNTYSFTWTNVPNGTYTIVARATDNLGTSAISNAITYTVSPPNAYPPVIQSFAARATTVQLGSPVTFDFTVLDQDPGQTLTVTLLSNGSPLPNSTPVTVPSGAAATRSITWNNATPQGSYSISLSAFDGFVTTQSSPITINVVNEVLTFIHPNVSGSPIMATAADGSVVWREDYSAFGERKRVETGSSNNQNWFIGKPQDAQTGLVYFGARWYDPQVGRFLAFDPAGVDPDNAHSFNRYAYGNNNPYSFFDPDGREPQFVGRIGREVVDKSMMSPQVFAERMAIQERFAQAEKNGDYNGQISAALAMAGSLGGQLGVAAVTSSGGKNFAGNQSRGDRLKDLAHDQKVSSAERGWIKQELNEVAQGKKSHIRNPPGKDLAHERGRENAKGYGYEHAHLQNRADHRSQHKLDNWGKNNKEREAP